MKVVFTSHRVENLPFLRREFESSEIIVLEEPKNEYFDKVLSQKIDIESYVKLIDTQFPLYTKKLIELLRNLKDKNIIQIEPYLEEVERIRNFGTGDQRVIDAERRANLAYIDYIESFMKKNFEDIIEKVIRFAKADAERFILRDEMRARAIQEDATIEAGVMHTKLAELLDADTVSIPQLIAKRLSVNYVENPGTVLTKSYIYNFDCDEELLAARSLIYISLVEKKELLPSTENPYPHFINEQKVTRFVNKLDFEKCRRIFDKLWKIKN